MTKGLPSGPRGPEIRSPVRRSMIAIDIFEVFFSFLGPSIFHRFLRVPWWLSGRSFGLLEGRKCMFYCSKTMVLKVSPPQCIMLFCIFSHIRFQCYITDVSLHVFKYLHIFWIRKRDIIMFLLFSPQLQITKLIRSMNRYISFLLEK